MAIYEGNADRRHRKEEGPKTKSQHKLETRRKREEKERLGLESRTAGRCEHAHRERKIVPLLPSSRQLALDFLLGGGKKTDRKNSRELIDGEGEGRERKEDVVRKWHMNVATARSLCQPLSSTFFSSQCLFFRVRLPTSFPQEKLGMGINP
jgi:hypothetical protein